MRGLANGLQSVGARVGGGPLGRWAKGATATEFSAAAILAASRGAVTRAWVRALAGTSEYWFI
jgi:hypothetical protein